MAQQHKRYDQNQAERSEYEQVVQIDRVARVVKGGRRFRFRALVVVGDKETSVGVGVAKGSDVQQAVSKAVDKAKKHAVHVALHGATIPHDVEVRYGGAHVLLKPAAPGTGTIAGGTIRAVLEGIALKDVLTKSLGSSNKINVAYATLEALRQLTPRDKWKRPQARRERTKTEVTS